MMYIHLISNVVFGVCLGTAIRSAWKVWRKSSARGFFGEWRWQMFGFVWLLGFVAICIPLMVAVQVIDFLGFYPDWTDWPDRFIDAYFEGREEEASK